MIELPKRFKTWMRFLKYIERQPEQPVTLFWFDNIQYDVREIKLKCFEELRTSLPTIEQQIETYRSALRGYPMSSKPDHKQFDWLLNFIDLQ